MAEGKDEFGRLSEKDISRVRMVDGESTLNGKPVSLSEIRGSQSSRAAETKIRRYEQGRGDKYSGTPASRQMEQVRHDLQASAGQQEGDKFETKFTALQDNVHKSSQSDLLDRTWNNLEQRFPRVMGAIGKALDSIGGR